MHAVRTFLATGIVTQVAMVAAVAATIGLSAAGWVVGVACAAVMNAAFIVGGTLVVAALQSFGATLPQLFLLLGVANIVTLIVIARTMPDGLPDFLSTMLRVRQPRG